MHFNGHMGGHLQLSRVVRGTIEEDFSLSEELPELDRSSWSGRKPASSRGLELPALTSSPSSLPIPLLFPLLSRSLLPLATAVLPTTRGFRLFLSSLPTTLPRLLCIVS